MLSDHRRLGHKWNEVMRLSNRSTADDVLSVAAGEVLCTSSSVLTEKNVSLLASFGGQETRP
jgi:hypothetical protein